MNKFIYEYVQHKGGLMSGLRKRKKSEVRRQILEVAGEMFRTRGYERTTINQIARKADIGTGTLYNYFSSKDELFLHLFFCPPDDLETRLSAIKKDTGLGVADAVIEVCNAYLDAASLEELEAYRELCREVFAVCMKDLDKHKEFIEMDFRFIEQLSSLLEFFKKKGLLAESFNPVDGAEIIYGIFMAQMMIFLVNSNMPYRLMEEKIGRQVRLFFADEIRIRHRQYPGE